MNKSTLQGRSLVLYTIDNASGQLSNQGKEQE
jgi:hypothetical protein